LSKQVHTPMVVARRLGISEASLARWRCDGSGPAFVKIGGKVGYLDEDLDAFIERSRRRSTARASQRSHIC
jgi:predicted site-specific integrase-resolvase